MSCPSCGAPERTCCRTCTGSPHEPICAAGIQEVSRLVGDDMLVALSRQEIQDCHDALVQAARLGPEIEDSWQYRYRHLADRLLTLGFANAKKTDRR